MTYLSILLPEKLYRYIQQKAEEEGLPINTYAKKLVLLALASMSEEDENCIRELLKEYYLLKSPPFSPQHFSHKVIKPFFTYEEMEKYIPEKLLKELPNSTPLEEWFEKIRLCLRRTEQGDD